MARPRNGKGDLVLTIPAPVAGINISTTPDKLEAIEAEHLVGFEFDEYGSIGGPRTPKDLGNIVASATLLSAHVFHHTGGSSTPQLIVHLSDGTLRYSTDFLTTSTTATWSTIASGLSTTVPFRYVTWLSAVWMTNGVNDFRKWDGTTSTTYASAPKGLGLAVWRDTMWTFGDGDPTRVKSSAPGDPTTWPAVNFVDVGKGEGLHGIQAIFSVEAALIVFKRDKTYIIYDPVEFTNRVIDHSKGCIAQTAVIAHNGIVYFMSGKGFCRFLGDAPSEIISPKLQSLFSNLKVFGSSLATDLLELTFFPGFPVAYSFQNFVGWWFPSIATGEFLKYFPDLPDQPWIWGTPSAAPTVSGRKWAGNVYTGNRVEELYSIQGGTTAKLFREYGGTTSETLTCEWRTAWFDFDNPVVEKYIYMIEVMHRGNFTLTINRDFKNQDQGGEDNEQLIAGASAPLAKFSRTRVYTDVYAQQFQLVFRNTTAEETAQYIGPGYDATLYASRFSSAISRVVVHAKLLSEMHVA